jgi:hypothetical protein
MRTYPAEMLHLRNVFCNDRRLLTVMEAIELGDVVDLYVIPDAVSETRLNLAWKWLRGISHLLTCDGQLVCIHCTRL